SLEMWTDPKRSSLGVSIDNSMFDKYKKELSDIEVQIKKIQQTKVITEDNLPKVKDTNKEVSGLLDNISGVGKMLGIAFSAQQLVSFGVELFNIAKQAEGVELAFAKIGDQIGRAH